MCDLLSLFRSFDTQVNQNLADHKKCGMREERRQMHIPMRVEKPQIRGKILDVGGFMQRCTITHIIHLSLFAAYLGIFNILRTTQSIFR